MTSVGTSVAASLTCRLQRAAALLWTLRDLCLRFSHSNLPSSDFMLPMLLSRHLGVCYSCNILPESSKNVLQDRVRNFQDSFPNSRLANFKGNGNPNISFASFPKKNTSKTAGRPPTAAKNFPDAFQGGHDNMQWNHIEALISIFDTRSAKSIRRKQRCASDNELVTFSG